MCGKTEHGATPAGRVESLQYKAFGECYVVGEMNISTTHFVGRAKMCGSVCPGLDSRSVGKVVRRLVWFVAMVAMKNDQSSATNEYAHTGKQRERTGHGRHEDARDRADDAD